MGFFAERPRYEPDPRPESRNLAVPPFTVPFEVPGVVPIVPSILAHTDSTVLAVTHVRCYRQRFVIRLGVRLRTFDHLDLARGRDISAFWPGRWITYNLVYQDWQDERFTPGVIPDFPPPELLRFGVQYPDGRVATNLDEWPPAPERVQAGPILAQIDFAGRASLRSVDVDYALMPLPPAGVVSVVCEWPARDIGETRLRIDAQQILDASAQSTLPWPAHDTG